MKFETIMVGVGRDFTVRLKARPGSGYFWQVHTVARGIKLVDSRCDALRKNGNAIQVFCLRASEAGEYIISFVYKDPIDGDAIQTHTVNVIASG